MPPAAVPGESWMWCMGRYGRNSLQAGRIAQRRAVAYTGLPGGGTMTPDRECTADCRAAALACRLWVLS